MVIFSQLTVIEAFPSLLSTVTKTTLWEAKVTPAKRRMLPVASPLTGPRLATERTVSSMLLLSLVEEGVFPWLSHIPARVPVQMRKD